VITTDPLARTKQLVKKYREAAGGAVVATVVVGIVLNHKLTWGDVATWAVAVTTLLTFLAATFAGVIAYDLFKIERARDLEAAEERATAAADRARAEADRNELRQAALREQAAQRVASERTQASKVTAWFGRAEDGILWAALVYNASELPIFDVRAFFYSVEDPGGRGSWTTTESYASMERLRVVPPTRTRALIPWQENWDVGELADEDTYLVAIEFTDANGIYWKRDERARLTKSTEVVEVSES
jgi:hypothetical protein